MFTAASVLGPIYLQMLTDNEWINKHACQERLQESIYLTL